MIEPAQWIQQQMYFWMPENVFFEQEETEWDKPLIKPYKEENVNPASYDVTLHQNIIRNDGQIHDLRSSPYTMEPHEFIIASTIEKVNIPTTHAADLKLKSTIGRMGINHALSGWIDPGFSGQITLELQNISGRQVKLYYEMKIAQLIFMKLVEETKMSYSKTGRYQNQQGPTLPREKK